MKTVTMVLSNGEHYTLKRLLYHYTEYQNHARLPRLSEDDWDNLKQISREFNGFR